MGKPEQPRSIDLEAMSVTNGRWDWGIYNAPGKPDILKQLTLNTTLQAFTQNTALPAKPTKPTKPLSFAEQMRQTKLKNTQERWQINSEQLQRLQQERERTSSEKEKIRQEHDIQEKEALLTKLEQEIQQLTDS